MGRRKSPEDRSADAVARHMGFTDWDSLLYHGSTDALLTWLIGALLGRLVLHSKDVIQVFSHDELIRAPAWWRRWEEDKQHVLVGVLRPGEGLPKGATFHETLLPNRGKPITMGKSETEK